MREVPAADLVRRIVGRPVSKVLLIDHNLVAVRDGQRVPKINGHDATGRHDATVLKAPEFEVVHRNRERGTERNESQRIATN